MAAARQPYAPRHAAKLLRQRLFSTHGRASHLPAALRSASSPDASGGGGGGGRLVVVMRNPKDAIVSCHFFRHKLARAAGIPEPSGREGWSMQEMCDAWLAAAVDDDDDGKSRRPGVYGSYFSWYHLGDISTAVS